MRITHDICDGMLEPRMPKPNYERNCFREWIKAKINRERQVINRLLTRAVLLVGFWKRHI
jgi:hypothetical protein